MEEAEFIVPKTLHFVVDGVHWETVKPYEDNYFVLQKYTGSKKREKIYRIILKAAKKKIAQGNSVNSLVNLSWNYLHDELPKLIPAKLDSKAKLNWIIKHLEAYASEFNNKKGETDKRSSISSSDESVAESEDSKLSSSTIESNENKHEKNQLRRNDLLLEVNHSDNQKYVSSSEPSSPSITASSPNLNLKKEKVEKARTEEKVNMPEKTEKVDIGEKEEKRTFFNRKIVSQAPPLSSSNNNLVDTQSSDNITKSILVILFFVNLVIIFLRRCSDDTYIVVLILINICMITFLKRNNVDVVTAYQKTKLKH